MKMTIEMWPVDKSGASGQCSSDFPARQPRPGGRLRSAEFNEGNGSGRPEVRIQRLETLPGQPELGQAPAPHNVMLVAENPADWPETEWLLFTFRPIWIRSIRVAYGGRRFEVTA